MDMKSKYFVLILFFQFSSAKEDYDLIEDIADLIEDSIYTLIGIAVGIILIIICCCCCCCYIVTKKRRRRKPDSTKIRRQNVDHSQRRADEIAVTRASLYSHEGQVTNPIPTAPLTPLTPNPAYEDAGIVRNLGFTEQREVSFQAYSVQPHQRIDERPTNPIVPLNTSYYPPSYSHVLEQEMKRINDNSVPETRDQSYLQKSENFYLVNGKKEDMIVHNPYLANMTEDDENILDENESRWDNSTRRESPQINVGGSMYLNTNDQIHQNTSLPSQKFVQVNKIGGTYIPPKDF